MALIQAVISPEKILIVEDDAKLAQWTSDFLQRESYQTQTTTTGLEAATLIAKQAPNSAFSGCKSTSLDGLDMCQQVRLNDKRPSLC